MVGFGRHIAITAGPTAMVRIGKTAGSGDICRGAKRPGGPAPRLSRSTHGAVDGVDLQADEIGHQAM